MYNVEVKEQFIRDNNLPKTSEDAYRTLFNAISKHEESWGADICTQPVDTLRDAINDICGVKQVSSLKRISRLHTYAKWCIDNHIPNACDSLLKINSISDEKLRAKMVASPSHLQQYLDAVFRPEYEKRIDNTYRCFFWLAYSGMYEDDIFLVRASDVDLGRRLVSFNGRDYPIYEQAIPSFIYCIELSEFISSTPGTTDKHLQRGEGDILLRGTKPNPSKITFRAVLSRTLKAAEASGRTTQRVSYLNIWTSGLYYRMYERERDGFLISFKSVAVDDLSRKFPDCDINSLNTHSIKSIITKHNRDYERWKEAFVE